MDHWATRARRLLHRTSVPQWLESALLDSLTKALQEAWEEGKSEGAADLREILQRERAGHERQMQDVLERARAAEAALSETIAAGHARTVRRGHR
jgi:hypothetical protein